MICRLSKLGGYLAIFLMRYQASTIMDQLFVRSVVLSHLRNAMHAMLLYCNMLKPFWNLFSYKLCLVSLMHGSKSILVQYLYWGFKLYGRNPSLKGKLEVWLASLQHVLQYANLSVLYQPFFWHFFQKQSLCIIVKHHVVSCTHGHVLLYLIDKRPLSL